MLDRKFTSSLAAQDAARCHYSLLSLISSAREERCFAFGVGEGGCNFGYTTGTQPVCFCRRCWIAVGARCCAVSSSPFFSFFFGFCWVVFHLMALHRVGRRLGFCETAMYCTSMQVGARNRHKNFFFQPIRVQVKKGWRASHARGTMRDISSGRAASGVRHAATVCTVGASPFGAGTGK